jgi:hypothetical protein
LEHSLGPETEAQRFHVPDQAALLEAHRRQSFRQPSPIPLKAGPGGRLMDV